MSFRRLLFAFVLAGLAAPAQATVSMRNLSIDPEFVCPGQAVTLRWQEMYAVNGGNQTWGVFSTNNLLWDNPNDYEYMASGHTSGSTAASSPGTPAGTTLALTGGAPDGFWHDYSFVTIIPGSISGTNITFFINGVDSGPNFANSTTYESQVSITAQISCTQKAIYNRATLWEQEASARLVIQNSCGTPSNTPTRTATRTATPSATPTATPSATPSATPTRTPSPTPSVSLTPTPSPTASATRTETPSATPSATRSASPTDSATPSMTLTRTPTATLSASVTPSFTASPPFTSTNTPTRTESWTPSSTPSLTPSRTSTPTPTATPTASPSFTESFTLTQTVSRTDTPTISPTPSQTPIFSATSTPTFTVTPTATPTATQSITFSATASPSGTPTVSPSFTATPSWSFTATPTPSRTVTLTLTDSPTRTVSPTITETLIPVPLQLSVTVYNAAGERVRLLFDGSASVLPTEIRLDQELIRSGVDSVTLDLLGQLSNGGSTLLWSGDNDAGQVVRGGIYYFKLEYRDPFGQVSSYIKSIQVLEGEAAQHLDIFNSAGELAFRADLRSLSKTVTSFSFDRDSLAAGYDASGAPLDQVLVTLNFSDNTSTVVPWDGRDPEGKPLQSGAYTAVLVNSSQQGAQVASKSITIIRAPDAGLSWQPVLGPNPAPAAGTPGLGRVLQLRYPAGELVGARADLYNAAGERVCGSEDLASLGVLWLSYETKASGIYLAVVEGRLRSGALYRRVIKVAILH